MKTLNRKLTLKMLKDMEPGIFASGVALDDSNGINMTNSGKILKWVAVRGQIHDWKIYCHWAENTAEWIAQNGDKVHDRDTIRKIVPADDEAMEMYRD